MLNPESYIAKDGNVFYFELEEYNSKTDIPLEDGDTIKFTYDGTRYLGKVSTIGSNKNTSYILEILRELK